MYSSAGAEQTRSVGPSSTMRPARMTAIRSATIRAAARSWVTRRIDMPNSLRSRPRRSSTVAARDTSRAEVGSSHSRTRGGTITARAIAARWRWPPDSWPPRALAVAAGRPTVSRTSATAARRSARVSRPAVKASRSSSISPTVSHGVREEPASWKTI
ncbi:hypothetical protein SAZ11_48325 [Streptomyces sp. FXJ1.4098]|nr:hypothetical protein [Streptomyces sp. FXJ1.4098]